MLNPNSLEIQLEFERLIFGVMKPFLRVHSLNTVRAEPCVYTCGSSVQGRLPETSTCK